MPDLPSRLDLYAIGRDFVVQRSKKIDPSMVDVEGSDVNIVVGVSSVMGDAIIKQLGFSTAKLMLDPNEGEDLDRYVYDRYQETRKGAAAALGTVQITRATAAGGSGSVPIGTRIRTLTGVEYVTITVANFGVSDLKSEADVRAAQAGKETQVGINQITRFSDSSTLFDKTLLVNNAEPTAGGEPAENDDDWKNRVRDFWRNARRGILSAIEAGATSVPGVTSAQAIEALAPGALPARVVNLYISDSTGVASRALGDKVRTALDDYRAGGIAVLISTSIPLIVQIQLKLSFRANVDTRSLTDQVRAAVVGFVNSIPVNGTLYVSDLASVLRRFVEDGLIVADDTITAPVGDLVPDVGQTIRTTTDNVLVA
jgi:hypothetical protein